jgi:hypothetical protein
VTRRFLQPVLTCTLAIFLLRLGMVPIVDVFGRGWAANAALTKVMPDVPADKHPSMAWGGWLKLPWTRIMLNPKPEALDELLGEANKDQVGRTRDFRDYYSGYLLCVVIGCTWWIGALVGVIVVCRRGSVLDVPWGLFAGAAAGIAVSATIGCAVVALDLGPNLFWDLTLRGQSGGFYWLFVWSALTLAWWIVLGILLGVGLTFLGPLGRPFLLPFQCALSSLFRLFGLRRISEFFAPW